MAVSVRRLGQSDSKSLASLILGSYDDGIGMWFANRPSGEEVSAIVARKLEMLREGTIIDNIAVLDGTVVGDCEIVVDKQAGLLGMLVGVDRRGAGIGRALLLASLKDAVSRGLALVVAEVEEGNANAISFFTRNGFAISGKDIVERNGKSCGVIRLEFRTTAE